MSSDIRALTTKLRERAELLEKKGAALPDFWQERQWAIEGDLLILLDQIDLALSSLRRSVAEDLARCLEARAKAEEMLRREMEEQS